MERQIEWHFTPLPRQAEALQYLSNDSSVNYVLYGGAAGGGKTMLGCTWQILGRLKYPGTRGLIGRAKLDTLKKTTVATFLEVANMIGLVAGKDFTYNQQSHIIKFMNGSEIILADLFLYPSDVHMTDLGGLELTDFLIDEAAEVSEKAFNIVSSRVRYKLTYFCNKCSAPELNSGEVTRYENEKPVEWKCSNCNSKSTGLIPKGLITCNPSKNWIYNQFYLPHKNNVLPEYKAFVQALPGDNLHLPSAYVQSLSRLPEVDRKRLLEGDWEYDNSADRLYQYEELIRCFRDPFDNGQMYLTGDIARLGKDRTVLCIWKGMSCIDIVVLSQKRIDETKREIQRLMQQYTIKLSNIVLDEDGVGGGLVDTLRCRGFQNGSKAVRGSQYQNLKADCYFKLGELIDKNELTLPIRYQEDIVKELEMVRRVNPDSDGKLKVTSKETISQRTGGLSPDFADAIMMRAYFELVPNYNKYAFI
jgi:phage terminase large subunit